MHGGDMVFFGTDGDDHDAKRFAEALGGDLKGPVSDATFAWHVVAVPPHFDGHVIGYRTHDQGKQPGINFRSLCEQHCLALTIGGVVTPEAPACHSWTRDSTSSADTVSTPQ